ncbi:MAG: hypothetical protein C4551_07840 [Bacillota bacterium]|nr:MAG: hypothetical protein C4551_07840 [Bacillota bacterium]
MGLSSGLLTFFISIGAFISLLMVGACAAVVRVWPGFVMPMRRLALGWLVHALGMGVWIAVTATSTRPGTTADPGSVPVRLLAAVAAVGVAAVITFAVLRLRHRNAWVFFVLLAVMSALSVAG